MDIFKELTGIDLMEMQGEKMKDKEKREDMLKKKREDDAARHEEEARK
jgi:hypothetical protein